MEAGNSTEGWRVRRDHCDVQGKVGGEAGRYSQPSLGMCRTRDEGGAMPSGGWLARISTYVVDNVFCRMFDGLVT